MCVNHIIYEQLQVNAANISKTLGGDKLKDENQIKSKNPADEIYHKEKKQAFMPVSVERLEKSTDIILNRKYKDTFFAALFNDPQYAFEVYQELHPEDTQVTMHVF